MYLQSCSVTRFVLLLCPFCISANRWRLLYERDVVQIYLFIPPLFSQKRTIHQRRVLRQRLLWAYVSRFPSTMNKGVLQRPSTRQFCTVLSTLCSKCSPWAGVGKWNATRLSTYASHTRDVVRTYAGAVEVQHNSISVETTSSKVVAADASKRQTITIPVVFYTRHVSCTSR